MQVGMLTLKCVGERDNIFFPLTCLFSFVVALAPIVRMLQGRACVMNNLTLQVRYRAQHRSLLLCDPASRRSGLLTMRRHNRFLFSFFQMPGMNHR